MKLESKIFRAYDIRGKAFVDFDEDGFFVIAAAFGKYVAQKFKRAQPKIFVSGDGRISQEELWPAVAAGLKSAGCEVVWGGSLPTPVNYFALHEGKFDAAVQITASHNPPEENGLKLVDRDGAVCGEEIQRIRKLAECTKCLKTKLFGTCAKECKQVDFAVQYEKKIQHVTSAQKQRKIVVDCGNGIAGIFYPQIFRAFGHEVIELFCDLDPTFPHHQPDPERVENMRDLVKKVREEKADLGFAFDGDGDRIGVGAANGSILSADKILFVLAADFLSRNPKSTIVVDSMSSATLIEKIKSRGGIPVLSKTGHSYIEEKMKETGAKLGGEQSGHFMFGENFYGHDDALLAGLRFLTAVEKQPNLIQEITNHWPTMLEFSEKFKVSDEKKFEVMKKVETQLIASLRNHAVKISTLDGVRIDFFSNPRANQQICERDEKAMKQCESLQQQRRAQRNRLRGEEWGIIRCSNTSPKIAVRIEAQDKKSLEEKKKLILAPLQILLSST